ncbi:MAG: tail fiber domain-containing protein, partial [Bdellovibrionota bacterium]
VASKNDFNSFVTEMQGLFNNTGNCLAAFKGKDGTSFKTTPYDLALQIGNASYAAGTTFGGPTPKSGKAITITKLQITGITPTTANGPPPPTGQYKGQFVIPIYLEANRGNPNGKSAEDQKAVGGNILTHSFNLIVMANVDPTADKANPTYSIESCAGQYSDFWASSGNGNDIIYTGGQVGIGKTTLVDPPNAMLDVEGLVQAQMFLYRSDARLKENVREIPQALDRVLKLHGVRFDWKDHDGQANSKNQLGLLAQEVEQVFPEVVQTGSGNGMKSVGYGTLIAPLVEAFKEQQQILDRQSQEIAELKKSLERR